MKTRLAVAATLTLGMIANACAFDYAAVNFAGTAAPFPGHPEGLVSSAQGVPFNIAPVGGNSVWCPGPCAGIGPSARYTLTANVGLSGIKTVYALMNTAWGIEGETKNWVQFEFENTASLPVIGLKTGNDLRDPNLLYSSHINGISTVPAIYIPVGLDYNPDVVDMVAFSVPESLQGKTLKSIHFSTDYEVFNNNMYLLGITASTLDHVTPGAILIAVPEPETYALMLNGLLVVGAVYRRRKAFKRSLLR